MNHVMFPLDLEKEASKIGLKINIDKINVLNPIDHRIFPISTKENIKSVEQLIYQVNEIF